MSDRELLPAELQSSADVGPGGPDHVTSDAAMEGLEVQLRQLQVSGPDPSLRDRCLPPGLRSAHRSGLRRRVLIADDEPNIRRLLEWHLDRAGYEVLTAVDGLDAWDQVRRHRPDLVVLDVMMPGLSGLTVLERLKADPRTAPIPVLLLTARGQDDHIRDGWQKGTDFYMSKPFNPEQLRDIVDRMVAVLDTPENPPPLRRWLK